MSENPVIEVERAGPARSRVVAEPASALAEGSVRLRVDRLAITANTYTYALVGDLLGYWDFYPSGDPTFGRVPAMGWAEVVESAHPEVESGARLYGWFPQARFVDVSVAPVELGLRDDGPHRQGHAPVYRTFVDQRRDPLFPVGAPADEVGDLEDRHALLRGLFLTGFLADAFLDDQAYLGAEQVVVLSASSKTAIGFAHQVAQRDLAVVGVTSPANVDFVRSLDLYDDVVVYDDVAGLPAVASVSVDLSGNQGALAALHEHLADRLAHSMVIGNSHQGDMAGGAVLAGPRPEFFFAPTAVTRLHETWGRDEFDRRSAEALAEFVTASRSWLTVERTAGVEASLATWDDIAAGTVAPSVGRITSLHD